MLESLPFVADPSFYAVAVPAVLLTGLSRSGFATGFGSLATPMIALTLPAPQAASFLLPLLLAMDAIGLQQLWRERDRALLRRLVRWGVLGVGLGGPPIIAYLLPMKMVPQVLSATMAVYFAVINSVKLLPYAALGLMDLHKLAWLGMFLTGTKLLWDGLK